MKKLLLLLSLIAILQAEELSVADEPEFENNSKTESLSIDDVDYKSSTKQKDSNYLEKAFSGNIGFSYFDGEGNTRNSYFGTIRHEDTFFDFIKTKLEYRASKTIVKQTFEMSEFGGIGLPKTIEIERKYNTSGFREAYVELNLGRYASVSAGKQVVVWGQFDVLSPIDAVLPFEESSGILSMSKAQNRLPINMGILKLYATDKLHIEAYYFPGITRDPMVQKIVDDGIEYYDNNQTNFTIKQKDIEVPKDEAHHAFRLIYYGDSFTFGVTKFSGYEKYFSFNNQATNGTTGNIITPHPEVEKVDMTGVELSVPVNRWTWKIDYEQHGANQELEDYGSWYPYATMNTQQRDLNDWVIGQNDGKLYIPIDTQLGAVGFEYKSDNWFTSFALLNISREFKDSEQEQRYEQSKTISEQVWGDYDEVTTVPMFSTTRYLDEDKEAAIGAAIGVFGGATGYTIYYKNVLAESLTYGISYDHLEYTTDMLAENGQYELKESTGGIRYFANYKF